MEGISLIKKLEKTSRKQKEFLFREIDSIIRILKTEQISGKDFIRTKERM